MRQVYTFSWKRRLRNVIGPIAVTTGVIALLVVFRPALTSWRFWALAAVALILALRVVSVMLKGRDQLVLTDTGLLRSGKTVRYESADLELQFIMRPGGYTLVQVILWQPPSPDARREGVGFDFSLNGFEEAVKELLRRVPDQHVAVTAPMRLIEGEEREKLLRPYGPSAVEKALRELGKTSIPRPPKGPNGAASGQP